MSNYFETIIIGSGISGLMTLKHLKEKKHQNILVIEKNSYPFGIWNVKNHPSVLPETYCVSSKLYMTISDFPMSPKIPEFPHHSDILNYYYQYAHQYNLLKHVKYNISVKKTSKFSYSVLPRKVFAHITPLLCTFAIPSWVFIRNRLHLTNKNLLFIEPLMR